MKAISTNSLLFILLLLQHSFAQDSTHIDFLVPKTRTKRTDQISTPQFVETRVITFNLRYDNYNDGENAWDKRKVELLHCIQNENCDLYCFQEALISQVNFLKDSLGNDFAYYGIGRDDGKTGGEYSPIFYNTHRYTLMNAGTYWLSPRRDTVSRGWDAACNRIVTVIYLYDRKVDRYLTVFNTHFDHIGVVARKHSAEIILDLLDQKPWIESSQTILCGDFNAEESDESIQLLKERLQLAKACDGIAKGTFNAFDTAQTPTKRIDFIFYYNFSKAGIKTIERRRSNGLWLSDHLAVEGILLEEE
ncbi:MAG: endonuclease/exonuclease/phosphatase family protein [Chitinophagales bacterium]|nr:endonuclease/exonuclease/phosphatase family protein [Chitinophagales bacterium]